MKFTVEQQVLSKTLNIVSKGVSAKTTIPILKGILINAQGEDSLTLSATDMDFGIEKKIQVNVEQSGSIVVPAKLFGDIVRKLPSGEIRIEQQENNHILIKTSSSEFSVVGFPTDEFPKLGEPEEQMRELSFDREIFKDMVKKTAFAASIDEGRGNLVGVLFELTEEKTSLVALDGFRMAVAREGMKNGDPLNFIIPAKMLNEINKIVSEIESEDGITILAGDKKAIALVDDTKIMLRLLAGDFLDYKNLIPKEKNTSVVLERTLFIDSIERASLLAKEGKNNLIKLTINNNLLTITSKSEEGNVKEEIIMEKTGEDLEIGFNSKYMVDVLKAIDDDQIKLDMNTSTTPCLVKPTEGDGFEYLVLPVRISSNQ